MTSLLSAIRGAVREAIDYAAIAEQAKPGEVWTYMYAGPDPITRAWFEVWTSGPVKILGEECPVPDYRGMRTLGEIDLDGCAQLSASRPGRALLRFGAVLARAHRTLEPGDTAPDMSASTGTGDLLASLPCGAWLTVEYRDPHPVYAGERNVVSGTTYDHDVRGGETGRDVGGDWVAFSKVTAVICHSHVTAVTR